MNDTFIPVDQLEWETTKINRYEQEGPLENHKWRYELELFKPYSEWDALSLWEPERLESMQKHIKQGDVLFEIGAEMGLFAAIFSKYMTENVVLVEPTAEFWPGIKAIYERNSLKAPLRSFCGYANDKTDMKQPSSNWPSEAFSGQVIEKRKYRNVYDKEDVIPSIKIDDMKDVPDHISIDVEGAELLVLKGAEKTLKEHHPNIWVSVHPDMLISLYDQTKEDVLFFMDSCGYDAELLAIDHEEHWIFTPKAP